MIKYIYNDISVKNFILTSRETTQVFFCISGGFSCSHNFLFLFPFQISIIFSMNVVCE